MAKTPEGIVKDRVKEILKKHNVWYYMPVSNGMGQHGISDFICCLPPRGRMLLIECKATPRQTTTALQDRMLKSVYAVGAFSLVVNRDDYEVLERLIILETTRQ